MRIDDTTIAEDRLDEELEESIAGMDRALGAGVSAAPPQAARGILETVDPTEAEWTFDAASSSGGVGVKDIVELERVDHRLVYVLAALRAMMPRIKKPADVEGFSRKMMTEAGRALGARTAAICWFDDEGQYLDPIFTFRSDERAPQEHELVHGLMHRAITRRSVVVTSDLESDPALPASSESRLAHPGVPAMAAGIFDAEKAIGAIYMDRRPGEAPFEDRSAGRFLRALAHDASGPMTTIAAWKREQRESSRRSVELSRELSEAREQASSAMSEAEKLRRALEEIRSKGYFGRMIGGSRVMGNVQRLMLRAGQASKGAPVLLTGEVGTGKTFIARQIHEVRGKGPFVDVNCAKLTGEKMESEFFGSLAHAYTGAANKQGYLRQANGGTLFLDEIAELPLDVQAKLLKALDEGRARPIGADAAEYVVDVRIIAATNQDLDQMVAEKRFRADLLSRLRVIEIHVPPIRERKTDLLELIDEKFNEIRNELGKDNLKGISRLARTRMLSYDWASGNVRELDHVLRRMIIEADPEQQSLHIDDLPDRIKSPAAVEGADPELLPLKDAERRWRAQFFTRALLLCEGDYTQAAKRLGINTPSNLRAMVKAAGIEPTDLSCHKRTAGKKDE